MRLCLPGAGTSCQHKVAGGFGGACLAKAGAFCGLSKAGRVPHATVLQVRSFRVFFGNHDGQTIIGLTSSGVEIGPLQPHTRVKCHAQSDSMRLPGAWCESARHCEPKSFVTAVASRGLVAMRVLWRGPGLCGGAHGLHAGARGGCDINHVPAAAPAHRRTRAPHLPIAFAGLPRPVLSTTMRHAVPAPHAGWLCACRERRAVTAASCVGHLLPVIRRLPPCVGLTGPPAHRGSAR